MSKKRILLVEDDKELSAIIQDQLSDLHVEIEVAYFVDEAIDLLNNGMRVDLIVSDYSMPFGDGINLLKYMVLNKFEIPFVFFTNSINIEVTDYSYFLGIISKLKIEQLKSLIKKSLFI